MIKRTPPSTPTLQASTSNPELQLDNLMTDATDFITQRDRGNKRLRMSESPKDNMADFRAEMRELFHSLKKSQDDRLDSLEKQLAAVNLQAISIQSSNLDIEKSIDFVSSQIKELETKISGLEQDRKSFNFEIATVNEKMENLERSLRKTCIEIRNVPKRSKEQLQDLYQSAQSLASILKVNLNPNDIKDAYRLPGKKDSNCSTIIIEFNNTLIKDKILSSAKQYFRTHSDQLNSKHLGLNEHTTQIYISEFLTTKTKKLHFLARETAKSKGFSYCWTSKGKVYLRKKEGDTPIMINQKIS
ncbi:hypothetical protein ABMA27_007885 [Loxostege sticticalis]|uniref:FP protein C-terminal domain-containing protein n=1 Tax=Loxostege sticticalis TaxID=481309 RepID=A0ABR3HD75_LOXSC